MKNKFFSISLVMLTLACDSMDPDSGQIVFNEFPAIWTPGETWRSPNSFVLDSSLWPGTQYARAAGVINYETVSGRNWCSASLIGSGKIVTALHCVDHLAPTATIGFTPSFLTGTATPWGLIRSDSTSTQIGLESLGFRGSALSTGMLLAREVNSERAEWICRDRSVDTGRDVAYFQCDLKIINETNTGSQLILPGDIYGWMDISASVPKNTEGTYALTANRIDTEENTRTLLSPNGVITKSPPFSCSVGGTSYSGCVNNQGADILPGSSGGAFLSLSDHKIYGVASGTSSTSRTPVCWGTSSCASNRNIVAAFSSMASDNRHLDLPNELGTSPTVTYTTRFATSSGSTYNARCKNDEAMIGVTGSYISPFFSSQKYLNSLGSICAPMSYWPALINGATYVQTGGSSTAGAPTPVYTATAREALNRYRNTNPAGTAVVFIPALLPTREFRCPATSAVYKITAEVEGSTVVGIRSIGCRRVSGSDFDLDVLDTSLGRANGPPTLVTRTCPAGRIAIGHTQWIDSRVEDLQLACRTW